MLVEDVVEIVGFIYDLSNSIFGMFGSGNGFELLNY